jgi:stage II sporulation protein D
MKKVFLIGILIILIPYFIVSFFMEEKEIDFHLVTNNVNIRVKRLKTNNVELVPLEEYVVGVVAGEMPIDFELEALKAQAVAARSYVLKRIDYSGKNQYDVVDSVSNQVYLDNQYLKERWKDKYVSNINKLRKAVSDTLGEVLMYNGKIADTLYFSTSNGFTEDSKAVFGFDLPYLRSVESSWDKDTSPVFNDQKILTLDEFYNKLQLPYKEKVAIEILKESISGRILELTINGIKFSGRDLYTKLGIRSTDFNITQDKKIIYIDTKGYGHGVGMSQYGANGMALKGYAYMDILTYYYQNTVIKKI